MTDPLCVLYVTTDASTGEQVESLFEACESVVEFSYVTSVEEALTVLETERIDHVVVDSAIEDSSELTSSVDGASEVATDGGVEDEYFRALAEALSDGLFVIDTDSTIRFANSAVEDLFGYRPVELVGEPLTKLMSPELAKQHREGFQSYLQTGERNIDWSYTELTGRHRDGHEVSLALSFGEFTSDGETLYTGMARDVSEREQRETELKSRAQQRDALATFSRHALENQPLTDLMGEATDIIADALGHEYAGLLEFCPDRDDFIVRAVTGWDDELVDSATIDADPDSQAGYTLLAEQAVVVENLATETRFDSDEILKSKAVVSGISIIIGSPDNPWGVLGTHTTEEQSYADHNVQFVEGVGRLLTSAIQRKERDRRLERYEAMLNAVSDGVYALDDDSRFVAVNDAYCGMTGYDREELLGKHASKVLGDDLREESLWIQDSLEGGQEVVTVELSLPTADGGSIPVEVRVTPLQLGDLEGRVGVVRDVSDRKRREEKLTSLNAMLQSLSEAESATDISDLGVDTAVETLGFSNAAIALYDDETNTLTSTAQRWAGDGIEDALLGPHAQDVAWQVFIDGESKMFSNLHTELDAETEMQSAILVPLEKYGVFLAGSPERDAFDQTDWSFADVLCSNVRSALGRAEREETLRSRRNELAEKNRKLKRINRLNNVIREITKALTQASSKEDVMQAVCDRLTEAGAYRFAWFGDHDRPTNEVQSQASAGVEEGYLDEILVTTDANEPEGRGPAGRAVRTDEVHVQNDLLGDPPFEPWRKQALERGYRSCASVPVMYGDTPRGVLTLYADDPEVFNDTEAEVLGELGEFIGYALNSLEQKQALASGRSIELDFEIVGAETPVLAFVTETNGEFEFESAVQRGDGRLHVFFTIRNVSPEETVPFAEDVPWTEDIRLVTERDGEYLYECILDTDSFLASLVDRGAMPRTLTATEGQARFVVRLPLSADVRTFVNMFENYYPHVELVARREVDEPVMTRHEFDAELAERLTDRQEEVVQTAYLAGFFEWPRTSTAQEVAETLDVSQPTVSRHVRSAERALFGLIFDDW